MISYIFFKWAKKEGVKDDWSTTSVTGVVNQ